MLRAAAFLTLICTSNFSAAELNINLNICSQWYDEAKKNLSQEQLEEISKALSVSTKSSIYRHINNRDSFYTDPLIKILGPSPFSIELNTIKESLNEEQKDYLREKTDYLESLKIRPRLVEKYPNARDDIERLEACRLVRAHSLTPQPLALKYLELPATIRETKTEFFNTKINNCKVLDRIQTPNKYSEPAQEEDSQFLAINTTFKNIDSESRLPLEGYVTIKTSENEELKYDQSETILATGYGINFKRINPRLSKTTTLIYRIPKDIAGEVFWVPGRNPQKTRLWCTFLLK